ncbi:MAG: OmpA family protein [Acidobacteriota bacterium]|nr:OmpA family protein [Acidobacteriota bacterium]
MLKVLCCLALLLTPAFADDSLEDINFPLNSAVVVDGFEGLNMVAAAMAKHPNLELEVTGHTDSTGTAAYNKRLSAKRAERVKAYLVTKGAPEARIKTSGEGIDRSYDNATREGRFQNRRVTLTMFELHDGARTKIGWPRLMQIFFGNDKKVKELEARVVENNKNHEAVMARLTDLNKELEEANAALQKRLSEMEADNARMNKELVEKIDMATASIKMGKYAGVSIGAGVDDEGEFTARARGMYFRQVGERMAVQAQGDLSYYDTLDDAQIDAALIYQNTTGFKLATAASYKWASIDGLATARIGQAAVIVEKRFGSGKIGAFGTFPFADGDVLDSRVDGIYTIETYVSVPTQIGLDFGVSIGDKIDFSGYAASLDTELSDADLAAGLRLDVAVSDWGTWYLEAEQNQSYLQVTDDSQRYLTGIRLGSWNKARYNVSDTITPVDIPKIHYELLTRQTRTGNNAPIADAGNSQNNVPAGAVTLDGSGSSDPDGDEISFRWVQTAGPAVELSGAETAVATFTGVVGESYVFQLTVRDSMGDSSSDTVSVSMEAAPVSIISFLATPDTITEGQLSTLSWAVANADSVEISGLGAVGSSGNLPVAPETTTTYTLTASNEVNTVSAEVTVTVEPILIPDPVISFFKVTPDTITEGESSTLTWATINATSVTISGLGEVPASGSLLISPEQTTTYTLTATNEEDVTVTAETTLTVEPVVIPDPVISFFTAIPSDIQEGQSTSLSWSTQFADMVELVGFGRVNGEGSLLVNPTQTTTYTLKASNQTGEVMAEVTVTVTPIEPPNTTPVAEAGPDQVLAYGVLTTTLDGSKSFDPDGDALTYNWEVIGGRGATLSGANTATPGVTLERMNETYIFRLTVSDGRGGVSTDTVMVNTIDFR